MKSKLYNKAPERERKAVKRVIIDAKSILGVLGLDLGRVLTVTCHGESQKFDNFLQQYAVA